MNTQVSDAVRSKNRKLEDMLRLSKAHKDLIGCRLLSLGVFQVFFKSLTGALKITKLAMRRERLRHVDHLLSHVQVVQVNQSVGQ